MYTNLLYSFMNHQKISLIITIFNKFKYSNTIRIFGISQVRIFGIRRSSNIRIFDTPTAIQWQLQLLESHIHWSTIWELILQLVSHNSITTTSYGSNTIVFNQKEINKKGSFTTLPNLWQFSFSEQLSILIHIFLYSLHFPSSLFLTMSSELKSACTLDAFTVVSYFVPFVLILVYKTMVPHLSNGTAAIPQLKNSWKHNLLIVMKPLGYFVANTC